MRNPMHFLASGVLALGAALLGSSLTPAAGLERRPVLAVYELDQPTVSGCAIPCAGLRIEQPGAGGGAANAVGTGTGGVVGSDGGLGGGLGGDAGGGGSGDSGSGTGNGNGKGKGQSKG